MDNHEQYSLPSGEIQIWWPNMLKPGDLTNADLQDLEWWLELIRRKIARAGSAPPPAFIEVNPDKERGDGQQ